MTHILHIDTSGPECTIAIATDGVPAAVRQHSGERDQASVINRLVDEVLAEAGITFPAISAIAVCAGPGSYTGLRIGLATAKGYCYTLGKPLILHSRLQLLGNSIRLRQPGARIYISILPARVGEYYISAMDGDGQEIMAPGHYATPAIISRLKQYAGSIACGKYEEDLKAAFEADTITFFSMTAPDKESWAVKSLQDYKNQFFNSLSEAEPFYLKQVFINTKL